jgi:hypothetical protein
MSLVFQNIDPPPPSPPGECVLPPPTEAGGTHSPGGKGGGGSIFWTTRDIGFLLLQSIISLRSYLNLADIVLVMHRAPGDGGWMLGWSGAAEDVSPAREVRRRSAIGL